MKIRRVLQRDRTGCGIACAAMLSSVSYAEAKRAAIALEVITKKPPYYTKAGELYILLKRLGLRVMQGRRLTKWDSLDKLSIVGINYQRENHTWHWVVYVPDEEGGYVLDLRRSVKTNKRTDFSRIRPRSYIPVTRP